MTPNDQNNLLNEFGLLEENTKILDWLHSLKEVDEIKICLKDNSFYNPVFENYIFESNYISYEKWILKTFSEINKFYQKSSTLNYVIKAYFKTKLISSYSLRFNKVCFP